MPNTTFGLRLMGRNPSSAWVEAQSERRKGDLTVFT